ncbi:hypothetical protein H310_13418 [Aphanomyces invadans]|uniref:Uncharacterized protein n=1 Tax=Aphanomyces invadans TaxID=157072 RepID=A0A024TEZ9_9STRA|nr:hypothetical protein H310_13418 [Aphanomyces invadans]ETV92171.1 hypothetical protein H310_13418 [Aphanomyces invadans]|eukprot:XP_008879135.1 hypothetical protein H310_13418 [Aphanomyces invadans]
MEPDAAVTAYRDWSAASVFGSTEQTPRMHVAPPSISQHHAHRALPVQVTSSVNTWKVPQSRPTPPPRRVQPHPSPRAVLTHTTTHSNATVTAAATLIQRSMRVGFFRLQAARYAAQVDGMTRTLQDMAVRTLQSSFRRHLDKVKRQKCRNRLETWMLGRCRRLQFLRLMDIRRKEHKEFKQQCSSVECMQSWWRRHHLHRHQSIAATTIQCCARRHAARQQHRLRLRYREGARRTTECWRLHDLHRGFRQLTSHMERERRRRRNLASVTIQRLFRGHRSRRWAQELRRHRFQCSNCGLVEPGGFYCKGCGRPKGKRSKSRKNVAYPPPETTVSPRMSLAPMTGLTLPNVPPVLSFRSTSIARAKSRVADSAMHRAATIDIKEHLRGEKAARMMLTRLQRSNQYLHQTSSPGKPTMGR